MAKKIKIKYEHVDIDTVELSVISISVDFPKFEKSRKLYRYELCEYLSFLSEKLSEEALNINKRFIFDDFFVLNVSNAELDDILVFLSENTVYEDVLFNSEYKMLNAIIEQKKKDPKFWEV